jgi:hypothetical protein
LWLQLLQHPLLQPHRYHQPTCPASCPASFQGLTQLQLLLLLLLSSALQVLLQLPRFPPHPSFHQH